jgi:hypothetical protein
MPFPGPPAPRKPKTGLIVLIVVAVVVVLGGGGTAAFLLLSKPTPAAAGRYTGPPPACAKLDVPPYSFSVNHPTSLEDGQYAEGCDADVNGQADDGSAGITIWRYLGSGGIALAKDALTGKGQPLPGAAFENPPSVSFTPDATSPDCTFEYVRSNEYVSLDFNNLKSVHDQASCAKVGLPIAEKLYALIG